MKMFSKVMLVLLFCSVILNAQNFPIGPEKIDLTEEQAKEVLVKINDKSLTRGQAQIMIEIGAAMTETQAAEVWTDIQLHSAEFERLGLDKEARSQFVANILRQYTFSNMLNDHWATQITEPDEKECREFYQENLDKFTVPTLATIGHISMHSRSAAQKVLEQAKEGADFAELYQKHCDVKDRTAGRFNRTSLDRLITVIGKDATDAIEQAKPGDIIGPFTGVRGFEIIKVEQIAPGRVRSYEEVAEQLKSQLKTDRIQEYIEKQKTKLKANAKIEKSEYLQKLEK